jgi:cytochrome c peroxidase
MARRGKALFSREGCNSCHPAPLYTDLKKYDLGTGKGLDEGKKFDTPALVEVWRTSPYLHDGRVETLEELIRVHNPASPGSPEEGLSPDEVEALAAYVRSL